MRSGGLQRILVLAWVVGCGDGANADGSSDTTGPDPTGVDPSTGVDPTTGAASDGLCVPGYESCPCFDDDRCISGLQCLSDHCVSVPPVSDDTTGAESTSASSSGDATTEESSSSGGDDSTSTGIVAVCVDDDTYCSDDELQTCVGGQWEVATCSETCNLIGYDAGNCYGADICDCYGHSDIDCDHASYNHCVCIEALYGEVACTFAQMELEYAACFSEMSAANDCWAAADINTIEDCEIAVAGCGG